jgi:hypothetical protein
MIDLDLFYTVKDSITLADCAIEIHQHTHFYTLYLNEKSSNLFIVERTKPSMISLTLDEFKEKIKNDCHNEKVINFLQTYEQINQKFELEKSLSQSNKSSGYKI